MFPYCFLVYHESLSSTINLDEHRFPVTFGTNDRIVVAKRGQDNLLFGRIVLISDGKLIISIVAH